MKEQRGRVFFLKKNISIIKAVRRYQEQLTIFLFSTFSVSLFSIQILFKQFFPFFDVCATSLIVRSEGRHFSFPRKVIVLCQDFKPSLFRCLPYQRHRRLLLKLDTQPSSGGSLYPTRHVYCTHPLHHGTQPPPCAMPRKL